MNKLLLLSVIFLILMMYGYATSASRPSMPDLALKAASVNHFENITSSFHKYKFTIGGKGPAYNERLQLEVLDGVVHNPSVTAEKTPDFRSLEDIVAAVVTSDMSDEQKSIALWRFAMDNLYDGKWGTSLDALEHLNVYGYGYCGTFASVLEGLWWSAGLRARHLNIGNHAATEVYYDNDWHYLDAHRRCYFLEKDNKTIASLDELNMLPELWDMKRSKKPILGEKKYYYMTMHPNGKGRSPEYSPDFTMAKGDVLTLTWRKQGKWCLVRGEEGGVASAPEPAVYANGTFRFYRDMNEIRLCKESLVNSVNIDWSSSGKGLVHPLKTGEEAYLIYRVRTPYFIPEASVKGEFFRKGEKDYVAIDISVDNGMTWKTLWNAEKTGTVRAETLTALTQKVTTNVTWKYSYLLRVRMNAIKSPGDVGISFLESVATLAYNPRILPAVATGLNSFIYRDQPTDSRNLKISHACLENLPVILSNGMPMEGEIVSVAANVTNTGVGEAQNVPVVFYSLTDNQQVEIARKVIDKINPGDSQIISFPWKATRAGPKLGRRTTGARLRISVDPAHVGEDMDWTNNSFEVIVPVLNPPDVRIPSGSFIRFDEDSDHRGLIKITATLRNLSSSKDYGYYLSDHSAATEVCVRFFDGDPKEGNQIGNDQIIAKLAPLETSSVSVWWDANKFTGIHKIFIQVSPPANIVKALGARDPEVVQVEIDLDRYRSCRKYRSDMQ